MRGVNLNLHIEELVIDGLGGVDGTEVGAAVERELGRLVAENGVPPSLRRGGAVARLDGGAFEVSSSPREEGLGGRIARAVYRGVGR